MELTWLQGTQFERLPALATSLALGLLMGLERERLPGAKAGLRTFGLAALFGSLCAHIDDKAGTPYAVIAGLLAVAAMIIAAHARDDPKQDPGATTVIALLVCYLLGVMVWMGQEAVAVMLAIVCTALLYFKAELRGIAQRLDRRDLVSILQFAVLTFIILPILPDRPHGPYGVLNPYEIWLLVVLISGVSLAGYIAMRIVGPRHGAALVGIFGGLVSSTATTLVYSRHAGRNEELQGMATTVIVLANLVLLARLAVLTAVVSPTLLRVVLPVLAAGLAPGLLVLAWLRARRHDPAQPPMPEVKNPTELRAALGFAAVYAIVLLLSAWLSDIAGKAGLYTVALVSGLTDVDAITLSSLRLHGTGSIGTGAAVVAIALAVCANTAFKLGLVLVTGGRPLFRRCAGPLAAVAAGLASAALVTG
ncbi:MAG TPA: MgtC/SapB family protein [Burkholderiales bacterium]|nr:MgtC/SapB family protein [Burkholderiales bacterium]